MAVIKALRDDFNIDAKALGVAFKQAESMQAPTRLKLKAREKWNELAASYELDTPLSIEQLAQYCEVWSDYIAARAVVKAEGMIATGGKNGAPYQHPALSIQNKCIEKMQQLAEALETKHKPPGAASDEDSIL